MNSSFGKKTGLGLMLDLFKQKVTSDAEVVEKFNQSCPIDRFRVQIDNQINIDEEYRVSMLKNITIFQNLSKEQLLTAAQSMEEVSYAKGEFIVIQDEIGDSMYILKEGLVSLIRKHRSDNPSEHPVEIAKLGNNSFFGEVALITLEPRVASAVVLSDFAHCLKMTKSEFDIILIAAQESKLRTGKRIARDLFNTIPSLQNLDDIVKGKLIDAMSAMTYQPYTYICRENTPGNSFFIVSDGICRVTVMKPDMTERETGRLSSGDYFGEGALTDPSNMRNCNVVASSPVTCMMLTRTDFNTILKTMKESAAAASTRDGGKFRKKGNKGSRRRITAFGSFNEPNAANESVITKRMTTFMMESLWLSQYWKLYREYLFRGHDQYGPIAASIMEQYGDDRYAAVTAIQNACHEIFAKSFTERSADEVNFLVGLLKQKSDFVKMVPHWRFYQVLLVLLSVRALVGLTYSRTTV